MRGNEIGELGDHSCTKLWLFIFFFALYALSTGGGHFYSADGEFIYRAAESIVSRGEVAISVERAEKGIGERRVSRSGLGLTLVEVPFYALGSFLARWGAMRESPLPAQALTETISTVRWLARTVSSAEHMRIGITLLANAFVTSLACVYLYILARALFGSEIAGVATAVVYGLGTMAWPYAKHDFTEPLSTLSIVGVICYAYLFRRSKSLRYLVGCGLMGGLAIATAEYNALAMPFVALYVLWASVQRSSKPLHTLLRSVALFLGALLLWGVAIGWYNLVRRGGIFDGTYTNLSSIKTILHEYSRLAIPTPVGLFGLLFSSGKGFFFFNPILFLSLFAWRRFWREHRTEALLFLSIMVVFALFFGGSVFWHGDYAWGPRHLCMAMPFLLLPIGLFWANGERWSFAGEFAFSLLMVLSVAVQLVGVGVSFLSLYGPIFGDQQAKWLFDPMFSPILVGWQTLLSLLSYQLTGRALFWPLPERYSARYAWGDYNFHLPALDLYFGHVFAAPGNIPAKVLGVGLIALAAFAGLQIYRHSKVGAVHESPLRSGCLWGTVVAILILLNPLKSWSALRGHPLAIQNAGFEAEAAEKSEGTPEAWDVFDWGEKQPSAEFRLVSGRCLRGERCLEATVRSPSPRIAVTSEALPVEAGRMIFADVAVKAVSPATPAGLTLVFTSSAGKQVAQIGGAEVLAWEWGWARLGLATTVPRQAAKMEIYLTINGPAQVGEAIRFDDLQVCVKD